EPLSGPATAAGRKRTDTPAQSLMSPAEPGPAPMRSGKRRSNPAGATDVAVTPSDVRPRSTPANRSGTRTLASRFAAPGVLPRRFLGHSGMELRSGVRLGTGPYRKSRPGWEQVEPEDVPDRRHPVAPADLLSLGVGPAGVGDRHLPDPGPRLRQPRRDLGLETEPVAREHQRLHQRGPHHLVAGLHVGQVQVGE